MRQWIRLTEEDRVAIDASTCEAIDTLRDVVPHDLHREPGALRSIGGEAYEAAAQGYKSVVQLNRRGSRPHPNTESGNVYPSVETVHHTSVSMNPGSLNATHPPLSV